MIKEEGEKKELTPLQEVLNHRHKFTGLQYNIGINGIFISSRNFGSGIIFNTANPCPGLLDRIDDAEKQLLIAEYKKEDK